jgi:hypothetical protein
VKEGRAANVDEAQLKILHELAEIYRTFDNIERYLSIIDETQARIERRVHTVIRYMDRVEGNLPDKLTRALRLIGKSALRLDAEIETTSHVFSFEMPLGEASLYRRKAPRQPIGRTKLVDMTPDPAVVAFEQAKEEYARRMTVTPKRIAEFLERAMDGQRTIRASEIVVENVDDFVVFQRLRETDLVFDGMLSKQFQISRTKQMASNEWIEFPDFEIYRVSDGEGQ